jgi:hypothetical protein
MKKTRLEDLYMNNYRSQGVAEEKLQDTMNSACEMDKGLG